jgi:hypothetical protein
MTEAPPPSVADLEQQIRLLGAAAPETAIVDLTTVAQRAIIELNRVAKQQATERRGQPEWGQWARLANAVRGSILQVATVRDAIKPLVKASAVPSGESSDDGDAASPDPVESPS